MQFDGACSRHFASVVFHRTLGEQTGRGFNHRTHRLVTTDLKLAICILWAMVSVAREVNKMHIL